MAMALLLTVAASEPVYLAGQSAGLRVALRNDGPAPVRVPAPDALGNWQPIYTLRGPGLEARADQRRGTHGKSVIDPDPEEAQLVELAPGGEYEGDVAFDRLFGAEPEPGEYIVSAELDWDGTHAEAAPVTFWVKPMQPRSLSYGVWGDPPGGSVTLVAIVGRKLTQRTLTIGADEDAEPFGSDTMPIIEVGENAADALAPDTGHRADTDLYQWFLWREGRKLLAKGSLSRRARELELEGDVSALLRPALMDRRHTVDAFAAAGERLIVARFFDHLKTPDWQPRVIAKLPLPAGGQFGAAISPSGRRVLALAAAEDGALSFLRTVYDGDGAPGPFVAAPIQTVDRVEMIPDSAPAVCAAADGSYRIAAIVRVPREPRRCLVIELPFNAAGEPGKPEVIRFVLPKAVRAARLAYYGSQAQYLWAIWGEDGKLYVPSKDGARIAREAWPAGAPPLFLVLGHRPFLVEADAKKGLVLSPP
jgi:hypothetical protein